MEPPASPHSATTLRPPAQKPHALPLRQIADCKGPADFDCAHTDLLYIYPAGPSLKAIYFIMKATSFSTAVTTPDPTTAIFLSDPAQPGPRFRLVYTLQSGIMSGKCQSQMPGQTMWNSYLEWSGPKQ